MRTSPIVVAITTQRPDLPAPLRDSRKLTANGESKKDYRRTYHISIRIHSRQAILYSAIQAIGPLRSVPHDVDDDQAAQHEWSCVASYCKP